MCDLVMKGGITSGVIYPKLVSELSARYRFKHIGGTSAGAIAAGACAAAEYGRGHGKLDAFAALETLPTMLGKETPPSGRSKLFTLFQPNEALRIIFDLDPGVTWKAIQEAAHVMHLFLEQLGLQAFLKTSGGKGLHVVTPIRKMHDWDTAKGFSQAVVAHLARTLPQMFVAKSGPKNRVGRIFIDYLRNGLGATTVCAWSARARPGLGISVPVEWAELPSLRGGNHWTIRSAQTRLDKGNAPWAGYARAARSLSPAMKRLGFKP